MNWHSRSPATPLGSSIKWLRMQGGTKKTATSKSAMARWKRSQLIEVLIAFFLNIRKQTSELPAMLKIIMAERNSAYTRDVADIAIS